jgi:CBS-domain-containing membrane protein
MKGIETMRRHLKSYFVRMRGMQQAPSRVPFYRVVWSGIGAFLGIFLIAELNRFATADAAGTLFLVGSFGASAVLVYGAPQADFSQPRNVLGGHVLSALIGIVVYRYLPVDVSVASGAAVSLSVVLMHLTRTLHPPGGATALITVIGGTQIHDLGFMFMLTPIATGALILTLIALVVNNLSQSPHRHYPRYWW